MPVKISEQSLSKEWYTCLECRGTLRWRNILRSLQYIAYILVISLNEVSGERKIERERHSRTNHEVWAFLRFKGQGDEQGQQKRMKKVARKVR